MPSASRQTNKIRQTGHTIITIPAFINNQILLAMLQIDKFHIFDWNDVNLKCINSQLDVNLVQAMTVE